MLFILFSHMLSFYFFREEAMCELAKVWKKNYSWKAQENVTVGIRSLTEKKVMM